MEFYCSEKSESNCYILSIENHPALKKNSREEKGI